MIALGFIHRNDDLNVSYKRKLCLQDISHFSLRPFVSYLVLSDMMDNIGTGFVSTAGIKSFGCGVKFESDPLTFEETRTLVEALNESGEFRKQFGKRPTLTLLVAR